MFLGGAQVQVSASIGLAELAPEGRQRRHVVDELERVQLERDAARLEGDRGQLRSAMARTKGQIAETELQIHLSPHWLTLRFATQSVVSAALVSRHRSRLLAQLERMPSLPYGIHIELT